MKLKKTSKELTISVDNDLNFPVALTYRGYPTLYLAKEEATWIYDSLGELLDLGSSNPPEESTV